ncbi:hypothetical protein [Allosphingosinicella deserti]|uniref:hypothetical protein n=1 Tax=Allosphingosinicella deserti TaxID=2116704 RepID=UPI001304D22F|nr:hypothetical protein [Sphingomonas deserti]
MLIVNWDAANGDPEFGAHLLLAWLRHRRPELLLWVRRGNVLIVESQATFGVPCQDAYDAAVGPSELPTSGLPDPSRPLGFRERLGSVCVRAASFPTSDGFENVDAQIRPRGGTQPAEMFPESATQLLTTELQDLDWGSMLYRGWFRRTSFGRRQLPWTTLVTTDASAGKRSTLEAARLGRGAIFATTMMLANTGQDRLVEAMLRCARGNVDHLPTPAAWTDTVRKYWKTGLSVVSGSAIGLIAGGLEDSHRTVGRILGPIGLSDPETMKSWLKIAFVPLGVALFELARRGMLRLRRSVLDYLGY